ncbi:MAG: 1-deoxy-D-xylulose-5-phosphate reductoisomerase [Clostridiales bacterium]|nr:1-deoxy-D-xylulose-5-phosphate reductoisomerase [Clostridiales bacterium]
MAKNISLLGSTGSIGVQSLDVARNLGIRVSGLAANSNIDILEAQIREFKPLIASVGNKELAASLEKRLSGMVPSVRIVYGVDGMKEVAAVEEADTVLSSIVGIAGLIPTVEAVRKGKDIALANKETLVTAGALFMDEVKRHKVRLFPVDSEHSAIFQCLAGNRREDVEKIILTASGGPFRGRTKEQLKAVTAADALKHPNWVMGRKITIDSATLMNKGLEVIEAKWLFDIEAEKIEVLVHPQSIIHSMVEYKDGSVMAQLGSPDMRLPIQLALSWPQRAENSFTKLDLLKCSQLSFEKPDMVAFPCLRLAFDALRAGGTMPAAMNGANESAVALFLNGEISFSEIPEKIENVMLKHSVITNPCLDDIIETDIWARKNIV